MKNITVKRLEHANDLESLIKGDVIGLCIGMSSVFTQLAVYDPDEIDKLAFVSKNNADCITRFPIRKDFFVKEGVSLLLLGP